MSLSKMNCFIIYKQTYLTFPHCPNRVKTNLSYGSIYATNAFGRVRACFSWYVSNFKKL